MVKGVPRWRTSEIPWYENQHLSIYDVPQLGTWLGRVGHVIDIFATPCANADDVEIWVYAAWNALPRLLLALYKPDLNDLQAKRWGGGHKRKPTRNFKIIDEIAPKDPMPKGLGWAAFKIGNEWAQRTGWYLLVADATTDFAVNWTSAAYTYAGCRQPGAPWCSSIAFQGPTGPFDAGTYLFPSWIVQSEHILAGDGDSIAIPPGYIYSIGASLSTLPLELPLEEASISGFQMRNLDTGEVLGDTQFKDSYAGSRYGATVYRQNTGIHPGTDIGMFYTKTQGFFRVANGAFNATASLDPGLNPDP